MSDGSTIAYLYDGSFEGMLSVVYESYYRKERPVLIFSLDEPQETLYPVYEVVTNLDQAQKVEASIVKKISSYGLHLVRNCYYSAESGREEIILNFLRTGFRVGPRVTNMLAHEHVAPLLDRAQRVSREAVAYRNFARFSEYDGVLAAVISPINFVLPLVAPYFCDRFPSERFLLYDDTHSAAFLYQDGKGELLRVEGLELPPPNQKEAEYRLMWKRFYDAIAIEARINHKRRMGHMPKRYWRHLTEFQ